jgi:hypothetical protein
MSPVPDVFDAYQKHLVSTWPAGYQQEDRGNAVCGARRFLHFLRSQQTPEAADPDLLDRFCAWAKHHRGLADATLVCYSRILRRLVRQLGPDPGAYTATALRTFVLNEASGYSSSQAKNIGVFGRICG